MNLLKKIIGIFLILLGIIGLALPFLQGILLILAGLALLGNKHLIQYIKKLYARLRKKLR